MQTTDLGDNLHRQLAVAAVPVPFLSKMTFDAWRLGQGGALEWGRHAQSSSKLPQTADLGAGQHDLPLTGRVRPFWTGSCSTGALNPYQQCGVLKNKRLNLSKTGILNLSTLCLQTVVDSVSSEG